MLKVDDVTGEVEKELEEDVDEADKNAVLQIKKKRPVMNFEEMGIPIGSELVFKDKVTIVRVADSRRVSYKDELHYLTWVTQQVMGIDRPIQPSPYWTYQGRSLSVIYNEAYTENEEGC